MFQKENIYPEIFSIFEIWIMQRFSGQQNLIFLRLKLFIFLPVERDDNELDPLVIILIPITIIIGFLAILSIISKFIISLVLMLLWDL